ncbi:hypothetical protein NSTCB13_06519 [Nostoc sp. DSM 114160]|jgi:precorrin-6Y C5,15-methyltransferase (decarboxylating)
MIQKWLSIVGIGEDGLQGLSAIALSLLDRAKVIVGGDRHLAMLPTDDRREKLVWTSPISASVEEIIQRRGSVNLRTRKRRSDVLRHWCHLNAANSRL